MGSQSWAALIGSARTYETLPKFDKIKNSMLDRTLTTPIVNQRSILVTKGCSCRASIWEVVTQLSNYLIVNTSHPDRFGVFQVFCQNGVFISAN